MPDDRLDFEEELLATLNNAEHTNRVLLEADLSWKAVLVIMQGVKSHHQEIIEALRRVKPLFKGMPFEAKIAEMIKKLS